MRIERVLLEKGDAVVVKLPKGGTIRERMKVVSLATREARGLLGDDCIVVKAADTETLSLHIYRKSEEE